MKIELDGTYTLYGDLYCFWIMQTRHSKTGKPYEIKVAGYSSNFEDLFNDYMQRKLGQSEADSMKKVIKVITETKAEIKSFMRKVEEHVTDKH